MGASHSANEFSSAALRKFHHDFTLLNTSEDPRYGYITLYQQNNNPSYLVFSSQRAFSTEHEQITFVKSLEFSKNFTHPNLVKTLGYNSFMEKQICGEVRNTTVFGEYEGNTLEKELIRRQKSQMYFTENEFLYIIFSLSSILSFLEENKIYHGDIRPSQINLTYDGILQISDHGLLHPYKIGYLKMLIGNDKCYLSPELLHFLSQRQNNPVYSVFKSDSYSLGMTLLYIATLKNPFDLCYDLENNLIDHDKVELLLLEVYKRYSQDILELVRRLLLVDYRARMSFIELNAVNIPKKSLSPGKTIISSPSKNILETENQKNSFIESPNRNFDKILPTSPDKSDKRSSPILEQSPQKKTVIYTSPNNIKKASPQTNTLSSPSKYVYLKKYQEKPSISPSPKQNLVYASPQTNTVQSSIPNNISPQIRNNFYTISPVIEKIEEKVEKPKDSLNLDDRVQKALRSSEEVMKRANKYL